MTAIKKRGKIKCWYTEKGIRAFGKQRRGDVVGSDKTGFYVRVHWDGLSPNTVYTYHPDFIAYSKPK